ncbi:glycerophosphodiester phosphodiesterase family protein [Lentibacter sp. XHP0401]|uniref:glycerophosphodiester phosphodiesterase family protein n=1 Tax=Lentibacter sp. XHP0401 TaxID=2984334 RepID=UPI0021E89180|nr:glycerophosphodiester phosphodiesterase family protein [Lentibacter sp. XHP0401]MCV2893094.1 glycerophosphodiester phosphodiesterase family protein [Lentibacter sp. XHP0401]
MQQAPLPASFLAAPIAHRGLHDLANGVPENSLASFDAAIANGYGIELDLQMSADGVAMVFHDYSLERLTGEKGAVAQRTAHQLGQIPLTGGQEGIPTLAQTLALVAGRAPLLIEIKDQDGALGPNVGPLEEAAVKALTGYAGDVALMSFNPHAVAALAKLAPHIPRGLTTCNYDPKDWTTIPKARLAELVPIPDFTRTSAGFISHQASDLASPHVAALKAQGVPVLCWTIRTSMEEAAARKLADNVTFEGYLPA